MSVSTTNIYPGIVSVANFLPGGVSTIEKMRYPLSTVTTIYGEAIYGESLYGTTNVFGAFDMTNFSVDTKEIK